MNKPMEELKIGSTLYYQGTFDTKAIVITGETARSWVFNKGVKINKKTLKHKYYKTRYDDGYFTQYYRSKEEVNDKK